MPRFTPEKLHIAMQNRNNIRNFAIGAHIDFGKCVEENTIIPVYPMGHKLAKDLQVGDKLLGDNSRPVNITSIHKGRGTMYEIQQNNGDTYIVNENHILCLKATNVDHIHWYAKKGHYKVRWLEKYKIREKFIPTINKYINVNGKLKAVKKEFYLKRINYHDTPEEAYNEAVKLLDDIRNNNPNYIGYGDVVEISVKDFINLTKRVRDCLKGYKVPYHFPRKEVILEPYVLGYWLGDGHKHYSSFTTADEEITDYLKEYADSINLQFKNVGNTKYTYSISSGMNTGKAGYNTLLTKLQNLNLIHNKHIPNCYKYNCPEVQRQLIAGFIDSDGEYTNNNTFQITQKREGLIDDLEFISRCLGIRTFIRKGFTKICTNSKDGRKKGIYHSIEMSGPELAKIPSKILRKKYKFDDNIKYKTLMDGIKIRQLPDEMNFVGFELDGNRRHLLRDFTVTHNSTVADSLLAKAGIISEKDTGERRGLDTRQDEQTRIISIKSTGISLYHKLNKSLLPSTSTDNGFLINLIDTPGHVDFSSEVTAALRVSDGIMIILDAIKGVSVQTKTVIKQALSELLIPVCNINKLDRLIKELRLKPEAIYKKCYDHINQFNGVVYNYNKYLPEININPSDGSVVFGSGKYGWGFTLPVIARRYSDKLNMTVEELTNKLWGDHYYHPKLNKWFTKKVKGSDRGFNLFVMKPLIKFINIMDSDDEKAKDKLLKKYNIKVDNKYKSNKDEYSKMALQKFLPNADSILEMIICHLPSPIQAQKYRVDHLYTGPKDDIYYKAIKECDPNGPLMMYISKLFPTPDYSRFYAFGRVFSGTIKSGSVHVQGPNYIVNTNTDSRDGKIQNTAIWMGADAWNLDDCPCGNTVALSGIDKYIVKSGTLTNIGTTDAYNIKDMAFAVSPVVSVAVTCKNPKDNPKLQEALSKLIKSDPLLKIVNNKETKQIIISGAGELHLEIAINDLNDILNKKSKSKDKTKGKSNDIELIVSDPVVPFRETITVSSQSCLAKSPNKLNRLYFKADTMSTKLSDDINEGNFDPNLDNKTRTRLLVDTYNWDKDEASRIWSFDQITNSNILIDQARGVQYLHEIKDSIISQFQNTCIKGPLCNEPIRNIKFSITDANIHSDNVHRGGAQIIPATRKGLYASILSAQPRLMEPIYLCEIECPDDVSSKIYGIVSKRRGLVIDEQHDYSSKTCTFKVHLPVIESIGFTSYLRGETGGKAFPQCSFSHWSIINSDPLEEGTRAHMLIMDIRKRKKMKLEVPILSDYLDRL
jgi:elongation factor 2